MPIKKHRRYRTRYTTDGTIASRRIGIDHLNQSEIYNKLITMYPVIGSVVLLSVGDKNIVLVAGESLTPVTQGVPPPLYKVERGQGVS